MSGTAGLLIDKNKKIILVQGDITDMSVDAIVNAANERLAHGGGVAGAIVRKGGDIIQRESNEWIQKHGRVMTGQVAVTSAGRLNARYVIHAVGPVMGSGDEDAMLFSATLNSLKMAEDLKLRSIDFPAISTGIFGYPVERCAHVMLKAVLSRLSKSVLEKVIFCLWEKSALTVFQAELAMQIEKNNH